MDPQSSELNLVEGRLGPKPRCDADGRPENAEPCSYGSSRLGLTGDEAIAAPVGPVRRDRSHVQPSPWKQADPRSGRTAPNAPRFGWSVAIMLVAACGAGAFFFTFGITSASRRADRLSAQVQHTMAHVGKLQGQRERMDAEMERLRTDLATEKARANVLSARLEIAIARLEAAREQSDQSSKTVRDAMYRASKAQAELEMWRQRIEQLQAERNQLLRVLEANGKNSPPTQGPQTIIEFEKSVNEWLGLPEPNANTPTSQPAK